MDQDQLSGRYLRLKDELALAHAKQPWPTGRIDRLATEIAETERAIAALKAERPMLPREGAARAGGRTPPVAMNRITPFGRQLAEPAGE